jgi:hypothetical protein
MEVWSMAAQVRAESEVMRLLDSPHCRDLQTLDYQILAGLEFGHNVDQLAAGCRVSAATIRRHLLRMMRAVFDFIELEASYLMLCHWSRRHESAVRGMRKT